MSSISTRRGFIAGMAVGGVGQVIGRGLLTSDALASSPAKPCVPTGPGARTANIAVSPDGRTVWTADSAGTTITAHRRSDLTPGRSIDVGGAPLAIAISPDGRQALVTTAFYDRPGLTIVDLHSGQHDRVDVGPEPYDVVYAPGGRSAYVVGGGKSGALRRVDVRSGKVHQPIPVGLYPRGFALSPNGKYALVALNGESAVVAVSLAQNKVAHRIKTPLFPYRLAVSPDGAHALVTHSGHGSRHATMLDLKTWRAGHSVRTGLDPSGVAFDRSGRVVMVANSGSGSIALVDPRSGRRRKTIKQGGCPRSVTVSRNRGFVVDGVTGRLSSIRLAVV